MTDMMAADKRCQDLVLPFYFRLVALKGRGLGCLAPPGALFRCSPATQPQAMLKSEEWQFPKFRTNILINQTINCTISIFIIIFNIWFDRKEGLGGQVVRFPDCHECQSGERTPWERLFFLPGPLAPKMLLLPPHTTYIIGILCTWRGPGHRRNFWNSILAGATADLDAPPVCPLVRTTHIYSISLSFLHGFATRGHFERRY